MTALYKGIVSPEFLEIYLGNFSRYLKLSLMLVFEWLSVVGDVQLTFYIHP